MSSLLYPSLRDGLVGAWCPSLGATGYTLRDQSRYNNHGTLTNMDAGTDWVASGDGLALDFDGSNDEVLGSQQITLGLPVTMSAWVYPIAGTLYKAMIRSHYGSDGPSGLWLAVTSTNTVIGGFGRPFGGTFNDNTFRVYAETSSTVSTSQWVHLAVTATSTTDIKVFINGISQSVTLTGTGSALQYITGELFRFSRVFQGGNNYFSQCQLDDIRIYNRALTPSEINLLASRRRVAYQKTRTVSVRGASFRPAWARNRNTVISGAVR